MAETVADRIKQVRGTLNQEHFAIRLGVHKNTVGNYERGREPDAEFCRAVRREFGISIDWLLTGAGPMHLADVAKPAPGAAELDVALMEIVVGTVVGQLTAREARVPPHRLGQLCGAVYRIVDRERRIRQSAIGDDDVREATTSAVAALNALIS